MFAATRAATIELVDTTGLPGGASCSLLQELRQLI